MRSLSRGLNVLDFIARHQGVTLSQIVEATGLSVGVTHRILAELSRSGFVWRSQLSKQYFGAPIIASTPINSYASILLSAAAQPMADLVSRIGWPSDLFVHQVTEMVVIESTRPSSPFHLRWSRIGRKVPLLLSSVGRAVLSKMNEDERADIYQELRKAGVWRSQCALLSKPLDFILSEATERGFAEREHKYAGPLLEARGEASIGIALMAKGVIVGALNIWWPSSADSSKLLVKELSMELLHCKSLIEAKLDAIS